MNYINHYSIGSQTVTHKGKTIQISNSNDLYNYLNLIESLQFDIITVVPGYEHRPDRISELFYGTVTKDWLIVMINNIKDPFQQLNVGDKLILPRL